MGCTQHFSHPERPRDRNTCGLLAGSDGLCVFHSSRVEPGFVQELINEVKKPNHWLEGALIKVDLSRVHLSGARLPRAVFEGIHLIGVALDYALLEDANFRSATLEGTVLYGSNLRRAIFDTATLRPAANFPVDLRNAELGGTSL